MKRGSQKTTFIFVVLIAAIAHNYISCKKSVPGEGVLPALKAAFGFKPGTYWVYQDSLTGEIDSFYVYRFDDFFLNPSNPDINQENINVNISQVAESNATHYPDTSYWSFNLSDSLIGIYEVFPSAIYAAASFTFVFVFPLKTTSSYDYATQTNYNDTNISNFYGNSFENVTICHAIRSSGNNCDNYFYLSPGIGMVKIVLKQPYDSIYRTWELERWNIVK